jgi:hypothetical protein
MALYGSYKYYKYPKNCHNCANKEADIMGSGDSWIECMVKGEIPVCWLSDCNRSQEID